MATINISVDPDLARIYNAASQEDQQKIQALVSLWLREMSTSDSLVSLMDDISDKAQSRGLTPEILESLLDDE